MNTKKYKSDSVQSFQRMVRLSLKDLKNPQKLGESSLLATPFILSHLLKPTAKGLTPENRGEALKSFFEQVLDSLWQGPIPSTAEELKQAVDEERKKNNNSGPKYHYLILELRYFRRYFPPRVSPATVRSIYGYLLVSESRFFEHLKEAQNRFTQALLGQIQPSLRLETPPLIKNDVGRTKEINDILTHLKGGEPVNLNGAMGIGKTTIAALISQKWGDRTTFWYTFRPGFNDNHITLIYSLSHFLHINNCSQLWMQLVSTQGEIHEIKPLLGYLRQDLMDLSFQPLFCFDEIDLVNPHLNKHKAHTYSLIIELLEAIAKADNSFLLLVGQTPIIDTQVQIRLSPFSEHEVEQLVKHTSLTKVSSKEILRISGGIPRIVELFVTLSSIGEPDQLILQGDSGFRPLFHRLWKRLTHDEKDLLEFLGVFKSYVPENLFDTSLLSSLDSHHLLTYNHSGGIILQNYIGDIVYSQTSKKNKTTFHQKASEIWIQLAQYTQAAYHLIEANLIEEAISLWYRTQEGEISSGNAMQAEALFLDVQTKELSLSTIKKLTVIQNQLAIYSGNLESVPLRMDESLWDPKEKIFSKAMRQFGHAHYLLGNYPKALETFDKTLEDLNHLSNDIIFSLHQKNRVLLELSDFSRAQLSIDLAKFQVAYMEANFFMYQGRYIDGISPLLIALEIAESNGDEESIAWSNNMLAICYGNIGELTKATYYADEAINYYQMISDNVHIFGLKAEIAGFYLNLEQFEKVIEPAEEALAFFEKINHEMRVPSLCSNLAEAYFGIGDLEKAEDLAFRAIRSENQRFQPYAWYTLTQIFYQKGEVDAALHGFNVGIEQAKLNHDYFILAYLQKLYGEILLKEDEREDGFTMLSDARDLFESLGMNVFVQQTKNLMSQYSS